MPTAVGSNVTFIVTDAPAPSTRPGAGAPVAPNGAPGTVTALMVSAAAPVLFRVTPWAR